MVQIRIKDNNRNREVAFIKTVPHTEKVFTDDDPKGHFQTVYYWEADPEDFFECKLSIDAFGKQNINKTTVMLIIDITNSTAHSFSPSSIEDWKKVFYSYTRRIYSNQNDNYSIIYLLWCLYNQELYEIIFEQALREIKSKALDLIHAILPKIARCLSISKQNGIKRVLSHFGINFDIYDPKTLHEAYNAQQGFKQTYDKLGLFEKIDFIFSTVGLPYYVTPMPIMPQGYNKKETYKGNNILLSTKEWLEKSDYNFTDDRNLIIWFQFLSTEIQLNIIRRYFKAIYEGKAVFSTTFVQSLKSNEKYDLWGVYRHCTSTPLTPIQLVVPLVCDCLLTLSKTKGEELQTYNGILDLAIKRCDVSSPKVDFGLEKIFPTCNGGATCNPSFKGFAKISYFYKLKESDLSDSNLWHLINDILGRCRQVSSIEIQQHNSDYICTVEEKSQYIELLNLFTDLHFTYNAYSNETHDISKKNILLDQFRNKIKTLGTKHEYGYTFDDNLSTIYNMIIDRCFSKDFIQVSPYNDVFLNTDLNLYNLDFQKTNLKSTENEKKQITRENEKREGRKVFQLVSLSLNRFPDGQKIPDGSYLFKYTPKLFATLVKEYYYRKGAKKDSCNFIQHYNNMKFTRFCAPEYEPVQHFVTGLPYFWCRGNICFKNCLDKQAVDLCASYKDYTLFHMSEIMGYSKLCHTPAGYEPNVTFRKFSALINRVYTIFKRLRCTECGSLMFPVKGTTFNLHNYYACNNQLCSLNKESTYLNYCYNCKRGLIDSRDTKQCPNGWYICPSCLSCCDNELIENCIKRYEITHKPIPLSLLNQRHNGHNDKNKFFCSQCGTELIANNNHTINADWICPTCKRTYKR